MPVTDTELIEGQEIWDRVIVEDWASDSFSEEYDVAIETTQSDGPLEPMPLSKPLGDTVSSFDRPEELEGDRTHGHTSEWFKRRFDSFDVFLGAFLKG